MLYTVKFLNINKEFEIYPKFKLIDKFSTELDMFEFTLKPLENELDLDFAKYNGFIPIVLKVDNVEFRNMYLTNYRLVNTSHSPKNYKYLIQATSPTFKLQRITLPNKLITQPITGNKRSVFEEMIKILEVYYPTLNIDYRLETLMSVACPELQFTKSTLHEVLISLFAVCGLAPKMEEFDTLTFIDLKGNNNSNWNSEEVFIRVEKSNSINNYADGLDFDVENAIDNVETITTTWMAVTSEEALVTSDNFIWKTPTNIYEISKVTISSKGGFPSNKILIDGSLSDITTNITNVDITDFVVSKEIYETLKTSSKAYEDGLDFKRNNLYYEGNIIGGGGYDESTWIASLPTGKAIHNVVRLAIEKIGYKIQATGYADDVRDYIIKVVYKSQSSNTRIKIIKENVLKPINLMISNQDDAFIDAINFGKQKQELINRLGNELILAQANIKLDNYNNINELNIPNLGNKVDKDYIITQREMQFNENNLLINYYLSKNYVFQTSYSGLNQIKRFTSIDTKNTLIRNDNFLYNYCLSFENKNSDNYLLNKFMENYGIETEAINKHLIKTFDLNNNTIQPNYHILVNTDNKEIGNSILCNFKFESNVKVGDSLTIDGNAYLKEPVAYVNNNGEFKYLDLWFGNGMQAANSSSENIKLLPKVFFEPINTEHVRFLINKDNREITSITLQFRVVGDNENVIVYNNFKKYSQLLSHSQLNPIIYLLSTDDEGMFERNKYTINTIEPKGLDYLNGTINFNNNKIELTIPELNFSNERYWLIGICDEENNLLFAINYVKQNTLPTINLYLNEI